MIDQNQMPSSFVHAELFAPVSYHTEITPHENLEAGVSKKEDPVVSESSEKNITSMSDEDRQTSFFEMSPLSGEAQTSMESIRSAESEASEGLAKDLTKDGAVQVSLLEEPQLSGLEFSEEEILVASSSLVTENRNPVEGTPGITLEVGVRSEPAKPIFVQQMSLPAALCDEALILEINSIPNKMGFKIGEVAEMLGIKQYVLRYWESEFDVLKPKKASNNQRYYTKKDVENAYLIRKLLHRDRFSIEGAKSAMKELKSFVKTEVKKERVISTMSQTLQSLDERAIELVHSIRRVKNLFA